MVGLLIMAADTSTTTATNNRNSNVSKSQHELVESPIFHDFLGMKTADSNSPLASGPKTADSRLLSEVSPVPSASFPASSAGAGGRAPISTTSDMGSERQAGNHLEGVPFYSRRSDTSGPDISNRLVGTKRSKLDSTVMESYRDENPQITPDSFDNSHLMKILRNGGESGEQSRRSNDSLRPNSASIIFQPPPIGRDKPIPLSMGPALQQQHTLRGGVQFVPHLHHHHQRVSSSNRFRDSNPGSSNIISQLAADEGSRTGIKGPGILRSISNNASERNSSSVVLPSSSSRQKYGSSIVLEPESTLPSNRPTSASRLMTIFYGGQAHVFDDVHPNKAEVIMALAGSNGGSWSTSYSTKSSVKPGHETGPLGNTNTSSGFFKEHHHGKLYVATDSSHGVGSGDRILGPTGGHSGSTLVKEMRNPVHGADAATEEQREL